MDSLLANYATSDEEDEEYEIPKPKPSLFSSLPPPKSNSSQILTLISPPNLNSQSINQIPDEPTSLFSSLPKPISSISQISPPIPKSDLQNPLQALTSISPPNPNFETQNQIKDNPTSLFSSLPKPSSSISQFSLPPPKSDPSNTKKIVQIKLQMKKLSKSDDDDDEYDDRERLGRKTESFVPAPSVSSFLSNILPAAKKSSSTLGALPSALGSGRRSIVETNVSLSNSTKFSTDSQVGVTSNEANYSGYETNTGYEVGGSNSSTNTEYEAYDGNVGYGNYDYYQGYNSNSGYGSAEVAQSSFIGDSVMKVPGKRGRSEIPTEIVEVKQDDLTKNRPREDQVKSTGIAFGPAYQPVSTKGKPSKLQKRKHQIGSLYFDMRQKESELAERRSKGFLTKAETQAKYGW